MNTSYTYAIEKIVSAYAIEAGTSSGAKYRCLYNVIKRLILNEKLYRGSELPSTRKLSNHLNISRVTVIKGYELLLIEKLISVKKSSKYFVLHSKIPKTQPEINDISSDKYPPISDYGKSFVNSMPILKNYFDNTVTFKPGIPPLDIFPITQWKNLLNSYWREIKASELSYSTTTGLDVFKESICNYLKVGRNINCAPEQLIIVSGSLQSLFLIGNVILNKNDEVLVENPTFPNVQAVFKGTSSKITPIELDDQGISVQEIEKLKKSKPKIIHVTPSNHYPLGIKMSIQRRKDLLTCASKNNALIIENDYEHELANNKKRTPTIYELDNEDRTIYLGTFNRILHPSIRLGFMVVPNYLVKPLQAIQRHAHSFVRPTTQIVMNKFIQQNMLYRHLHNLIDTAKERKRLFLDQVENIHPLISVNENGFENLHLILSIPNDQNDLKLCTYLLNNGIVSHPLSKCYIGQPQAQGLIMGYSAARPQIMIKQITKLKKILQQYDFDI